MRITKVKGENKKHKVLLYALSTCGWCRKTKKLLADNSVEYEYVDVDLCSDEEYEQIRDDIIQRGGRIAFPTLIIDDVKLITGFDEDEIRKALGI
ncbi:MAG: glutaredoxin family protein [Crenarchaeota archaeon]|nr:glutaredoxin family protein [Thermoproteota archaeon]